MTSCNKGWPNESNKKGRCCCNCINQTKIVKHPWNSGMMRGRITEIAGYGCKFEHDLVVFMENQHSMCEEHMFREE